ncbi:MAG: YeeE/YedE family protein, partial [Proteobacteria bacterium]|nr:YeeE/YedE family protein [Pseudomonadota bacterium]
MSQAAQVTKADHPVVFFTILGVGGLTLLLQNIISTRQALLFLIGVGLGISLLHAAFGFSSA